MMRHAAAEVRIGRAVPSGLERRLRSGGRGGERGRGVGVLCPPPWVNRLLSGCPLRVPRGGAWDGFGARSFTFVLFVKTSM